MEHTEVVQELFFGVSGLPLCMFALSYLRADGDIRVHTGSTTLRQIQQSFVPLGV